jgi:hypothetical protein
MPRSAKRWRAIAYCLGALYMLAFLATLGAYEWLRLKGARAPDPTTGETIARRMQQPFDIYNHVRS